MSFGCETGEATLTSPRGSHPTAHSMRPFLHTPFHPPPTTQRPTPQEADSVFAFAPLPLRKGGWG